MKVVQKSDIWVGLFLILTIGIVVGALLATSGWGIRHNNLYIRSTDVQNVAIDTKLYLQGLEVGRRNRRKVGLHRTSSIRTGMACASSRNR